jgi:hypothetical protein
MQGAGIARSLYKLGYRLDDEKIRIGFIARPEFFLFAAVFTRDLRPIHPPVLAFFVLG